MVRVLPTEKLNSVKPLQVIEDFKDICALGKFLRLYNSYIYMMVSDGQGNRDTDLIKHKVIFTEFIMATKDACEELQEMASTITTQYNNGGAITQLHWSSSI